MIGGHSQNHVVAQAAPRPVASRAALTPSATALATTADRLPSSAPAPNAAPKAATVATPGPAVAGATARLSIARIGIRGVPIYDLGTDSRGTMLIAPGYAVTHYAFSAPFGGGNAVLYGHDDIEGNVFGRLYDLVVGDLIQLTVGAEIQTYRVTGHQIVAPTALSVLAPTSDSRLTIITCWPFNVDTKRWVVTAVKI